MALFEGYERRIDKINAELPQYGFKSIEQTRDYCLEHGVDVASIVRGIQPIAFENAVWAYTLGAAITLRSGSKSPSEAAQKIGVGLQAFCIPGSVADSRKVGLGHGNLAAMLLDQPRPQKAPARHPQRAGQGRRLYYIQNQRFYLCADRIRL